MRSGLPRGRRRAHASARTGRCPYRSRPPQVHSPKFSARPAPVGRPPRPRTACRRPSPAPTSRRAASTGPAAAARTNAHGAATPGSGGGGGGRQVNTATSGGGRPVTSRVGRPRAAAGGCCPRQTACHRLAMAAVPYCLARCQRGGGGGAGGGRRGGGLRWAVHTGAGALTGGRGGGDTWATTVTGEYLCYTFAVLGVCFHTRYTLHSNSLHPV